MSAYLIDLRCADCGYVHRNASQSDVRIWEDEGCPNGHHDASLRASRASDGPIEGDEHDSAIHFTAIDHEAECIREALRKLPALDDEASRAFEALGYLLTTIKGRANG